MKTRQMDHVLRPTAKVMLQTSVCRFYLVIIAFVCGLLHDPTYCTSNACKTLPSLGSVRVTYRRGAGLAQKDLNGISALSKGTVD